MRGNPKASNESRKISDHTADIIAINTDLLNYNLQSRGVVAIAKAIKKSFKVYLFKLMFLKIKMQYYYMAVFIR